MIGPQIHPRPGLRGVAAQQLQRALLPPGHHRLRPRVRVAPLFREIWGGAVWSRRFARHGPSDGGRGGEDHGQTGAETPQATHTGEAGDESGRRAEATHGVTRAGMAV